MKCELTNNFKIIPNFEVFPLCNKELYDLLIYHNILITYTNFQTEYCRISQNAGILNN